MRRHLVRSCLKAKQATATRAQAAALPAPGRYAGRRQFANSSKHIRVLQRSTGTTFAGSFAPELCKCRAFLQEEQARGHSVEAPSLLDAFLQAVQDSAWLLEQKPSLDQKEANKLAACKRKLQACLQRTGKRDTQAWLNYRCQVVSRKAQDLSKLTEREKQVITR